MSTEDIATQRTPDATDPARPAHRLDATRLGYPPQRSVKWLSPTTLVDTAIRLGAARAFGAYLDKRELAAFYPQDAFDYSDRDTLGLDYVADVGDGFNATYSIAHLISQPRLAVAGTDTVPGGDILVMGGDEVYPAANWREYDNRTRGPYSTANPDDARDLYAVPGNHDWFDGLTAFSRLFLRGDGFGGWTTPQSRSYCTLKLPHRWWLMAIDGGFDSHIDPPQLAYFHDTAREIQPGDHVILCVPQPAWVWTEHDRQEFDRINFFIDHIIRPRGAKVPLILTGDRHHYAHFREDSPDGATLPRQKRRPGSRFHPSTRHSQSDGNATSAPPSESSGEIRHLVTAGGGGGYLSPTHNLPTHITAPLTGSFDDPEARSRDYTLRTCYPSARRSWRYGFGIFGRLPWRNKGFVILLGVAQLLAAVAIMQGAGTTVTSAALLITAASAFAHSTGRRSTKHYVLGVAHGGTHTLLAWWGTQVLSEYAGYGIWPYIAYIPVAGLAATWLVGLYLLVANRFGVNANELFAGLSIIDSKCFLRMRLDSRGLTVYPVGVDKVARSWRFNEPDVESPSRVVPEKPLKPRLIDAPIVIDNPSAESLTASAPGGGMVSCRRRLEAVYRMLLQMPVLPASVATNSSWAAYS
ncbi:hypothetical protein [Haloglycomyces albus]|uniref:hypothetical protein n=1 Tax=Haloglycomyces albus TaxID=526067 RepID=UPI00046CE4A9|nr:hypothetical protein [Haloglycomyces albus]